MPKPAELRPGTLDLLILKALSLGPLHGYSLLLRIEQISGGSLLVEQGALYPRLYRLEEQGLLASAWATTESNRRARFYRITRDGEKRLRQETESWNRVASAMSAVLRARPEEV